MHIASYQGEREEQVLCLAGRSIAFPELVSGPAEEIGSADPGDHIWELNKQHSTKSINKHHPC